MSEDGSDGRDKKKILLIVGAVVIGLPVVLIVGAILLFVLSAVLGTFVLGVGSEAAAEAPQAEFDFQADGTGTVVVTHTAGDSMSASSVDVVVDGETIGTWADLGGPGTIGAGNSIRIDARSGDSIRIYWNGPDGERTILAGYQVP